MNVDEITTEGAREQIDVMAGCYMGEDEYPNPIRSGRVVRRIVRARVFSSP